MTSKKGEWMKIQACGEEYGWRFVIDAVDNAVRVEEARGMLIRKPHKMSQREKEARIVAMAEKMGVRLYG